MQTEMRKQVQNTLLSCHDNTHTEITVNMVAKLNIVTQDTERK
jgi:hypothetical protein